MARTIQRLILICLLASCQLIAYGQTVEATVVDNKKQALIGVYVSCGKQVVQTNEQGFFKLSCSELGIYI